MILATTLALFAATIGFDLKLPLADSVIPASACAHGALVRTQDRHFKGFDGVQYVAKK